MFGLTVAALLQVSVLAADANNYAMAHKRATENGEPLVVLVGADWCPACQTMKHNVLPQAERKGILKRVALAVVNTDREPSVARQLMRGSSIPQLVMYYKTNDGWRRRSLVGAQSVETLNSFLDEGRQASAEQLGQKDATASVAGR